MSPPPTSTLPPPAAPARGAQTDGAFEQIAYDPEFRPAVQRGSLTPREAAMRGRRADMVRRLVATEGLTPELAAQVADRELGIAAARAAAAQVAARAARRPERPRAEGGHGWMTPALSGLAFAAVLIALGLYLRGGDDGPKAADVVPATRPLLAARAPSAAPAPVEATPAPPATATEQTRDGDGRLTLLAGPSPQAVLRSFVEAWPTQDRIEILGIEDGPFLNGKGCQAVYRVAGSSATERYAFAIRFDPARGAWVAGNGQEPIRSYLLP